MQNALRYIAPPYVLFAGRYMVTHENGKIMLQSKINMKHPVAAKRRQFMRSFGLRQQNSYGIKSEFALF